MEQCCGYNTNFYTEMIFFIRQRYLIKLYVIFFSKTDLAEYAIRNILYCNEL